MAKPIPLVIETATLFAFYGSVVEEIERLDADSGELRKYYDLRKKNRKEWEQNPGIAIFKELERFRLATESPAAIAYIEQVLPDVQDDDLRWRLEVLRQDHIRLASMDQHISEAERKLWYEKGLDNARRLLSVPPKSSKDRASLLLSESFMLGQLHRIDEMVAVHDQLILIAVDNPTERLSRLRNKAVSLMDHGRPEQAIVALRAYLAATELKTESWRDATELLAGALARDGQHDAAVSLHKELLNYYHDVGPTAPRFLISIAESQQAIGAIDEANRSLDQAEKAIKALTTNPDGRQNKQAVLRLNERIAKVRQLIEAGN